MKPEEHIQFLSELLDITAELREIVIDYCRLITSENDGHRGEEKPQWPEVPF